MSNEAKHTTTPWTRETTTKRGAWIGKDGRWSALSCGDTDEEANANADLIVHAVNSYEATQRLLVECEETLDRIFSYISYVNIHGVGEQPEPRADGTPQPMRIDPDEFGRIFQDIGTRAAAALAAIAEHRKANQ